MTDTIFALSSGAPPAAIAIIRLSGPHVADALQHIAGTLPAPRITSLRTLRDQAGTILDQAVVLWIPGPHSATGENCGELHCHGGRAVVAAILETLAGLKGLRAAEPGEFTRRAFANGRMDLSQAEALGDLLAAETELQRRIAQNQVGGALSRQVEGWRDRALALSAIVEAALDFSDEDDVDALPEHFARDRDLLAEEMITVLAAPRAERLREGVRVVIAGPPNAGKSSLFNALLDEDAAIVTPLKGTTRDVLERSIAIGGVPLILVDTAGLRNEGAEAVEAIGIARAQREVDGADLVLWLGNEGEGPKGAIEIEPRIDDATAQSKRAPVHRVSALTGLGVDGLRTDVAARAISLLPKPTDMIVNRRQAELVSEAVVALRSDDHGDLLLVAEHLRIVRTALDRLTGRAGVEDMLDTVFSRFCIGK